MEQNLSLLLTLQLQHTQSQKKRLFSTTLRKIKEKEIIQSFHTNVPKYSSKCRFRSVIGRLIESSTIVEEGNMKIYCLCLNPHCSNHDHGWAKNPTAKYACYINHWLESFLMTTHPSIICSIASEGCPHYCPLPIGGKFFDFLSGRGVPVGVDILASNGWNLNMKTILRSFGIHLPDKEKKSLLPCLVTRYQHQPTPVPDEKVKELGSSFGAKREKV